MKSCPLSLSNCLVGVQESQSNSIVQTIASSDEIWIVHLIFLASTVKFLPRFMWWLLLNATFYKCITLKVNIISILTLVSISYYFTDRNRCTGCRKKDGISKHHCGVSADYQDTRYETESCIMNKFVATRTTITFMLSATKIEHLLNTALQLSCMRFFNFFLF